MVTGETERWVETKPCSDLCCVARTFAVWHVAISSWISLTKWGLNIPGVTQLEAASTYGGRQFTSCPSAVSSWGLSMYVVILWKHFFLFICPILSVCPMESVVFQFDVNTAVLLWKSRFFSFNRRSKGSFCGQRQGEAKLLNGSNVKFYHQPHLMSFSAKCNPFPTDLFAPPAALITPCAGEQPKVSLRGTG